MRIKAELTSRSPTPETDPAPRFYIIFTDLHATRAAIEAAGRLASGLGARLVLLVAQVVPYPLPLDSPPVPQPFTNALLSKLTEGLPVDLTVRVSLCRDRDQTIRNALEPESLVVIGSRKHWWQSRMPGLRRLLQQDGHQVLTI
jgi:hypothetical protein